MTANVDFDKYWQAVDADLAACDPAPELQKSVLRSTLFATAYDVRMTSIGPYRIFGFLSVPEGEESFPALLYTPRYGSVNNPPHWDDRQRYVVLTLMHRGQRLADSPYQAAYPGLLTDGIEDPDAYMYRGIIADCLRGAEVLAAHPAVDANRIAIVGDDLAMVTAARRPVFSAMVVANLMFYRLMEARLRTETYPVEEINDYLRFHPGSEDQVAATLALFDPQLHAAKIATTTLIQCGDAGSITGPDWLQPLVSLLPEQAEILELAHEGGTDYDAVDAWLANQMTVSAMPRLWEAAR